ncbi:MAG: hypothetical protein HZA92_00665 [Verrucomicrobia bacterium]|nr:hypothetical protein [Verrucomicrobiota bacterium]
MIFRSLQTDPRRRPAIATRAVTILELLVAVSLISFIILALYQMFDHTQTQMRRTVREVDKFESGRAAADLLKRDVSQMVAGNSPSGAAAVNFFAGTTVGTTNWSAGAFAMTNNVTNSVMTNVLQVAYFSSFDSAATPNNWNAVAYRVASSTNATALASDGLGTLYRWTTNANRFTTNLQYAFFGFPGPGATNFQRIVDNVVHFRITAITNGAAITNGGFLTNTSLPSHVEIELGYVDSRLAERARGMLPNTNAVRAYLSTNVANVHLFRMQIPIRPGQQ